MTKDRTSFRILVVEDNMGDFILVEDYLTEQILNPVVVHAKDFYQASSLILKGNYRFDVILLDLTLPDKKEQNVVSEILKIAFDYPIIILTGYTNIAFSIQSISQGISDYLLKEELNSTALYKSIIYCIERKKRMLDVKNSEKKYSDLFRLNPQPMWVYDLDTLQFQDVNVAAINHYGYSKEEFLNMTVKDIIPENDRDMFENADDCEYEEGAFLNEVSMHKKKNGEIIQVELNSNIIYFKDKKSKIMVANDITEKSDYINKIEEQNKRFREISWIQSHVIRAPLARAMGLIDLLQNNLIPAQEREEALRYLITSANELDELIKSISDKSNGE